jgi:hypothetical protein
MRAHLVRGLGAFALWARHEILRLQREMTAALALRGMRDPFLGLTCQSITPFEWGTDSGGTLASLANRGPFPWPRQSERGVPLDCTGG